MVLIVAYSLLAVRPQGHPDGGSVDRFAGLFSTWPMPVLTLVAAIWAARGTRPGMTVWRGHAVGVLVAGIFGLLFFWPNGLQSLALFVPTVVAGFVGGVIRKTLEAGRSKPEQSRSEA
jgi:hypothetical protein